MYLHFFSKYNKQKHIFTRILTFSNPSNETKMKLYFLTAEEYPYETHETFRDIIKRIRREKNIHHMNEIYFVQDDTKIDDIDQIIFSENKNPITILVNIHTQIDKTCVQRKKIFHFIPQTGERIIHVSCTDNFMDICIDSNFRRYTTHMIYKRDPEKFIWEHVKTLYNLCPMDDFIYLTNHHYIHYYNPNPSEITISDGVTEENLRLVDDHNSDHDHEHHEYVFYTSADGFSVKNCSTKEITFYQLNTNTNKYIRIPTSSYNYCYSPNTKKTTLENKDGQCQYMFEGRNTNVQYFVNNTQPFSNYFIVLHNSDEVFLLE